MQIIDYSNKPLCLIGDLHGEFRSLCYLLKNNRQETPEELKKKKRVLFSKPNGSVPVKDCVMVLCGDCGFGFNKHEYYVLELTRLQKLLEGLNITLLCLRGNHDNPEYFETINGKFDFANIKFIPNYSILKTKNATSLCIGGAISYDRSWRLKENERLNRYKSSFEKKIYWSNEGIEENTEIVDELKKEGIKIDSIISHTAPFSYLIDKCYEELTKSNSWLKDEEVKADIENENKILENLLENLIESGQNIKWWAFGHTHIGNVFNKQIKDKSLYFFNLGILKDLNVIEPSFMLRDLQNGITIVDKITEFIHEMSKLKVADINTVEVDGNRYYIPKESQQQFMAYEDFADFFDEEDRDYIVEDHLNGEEGWDDDEIRNEVEEEIAEEMAEQFANQVNQEILAQLNRVNAVAGNIRRDHRVIIDDNGEPVF